MKRHLLITSTLFAFVATTSVAWAECYCVSVKGCDKEEKVCVDNSTPDDAPAKAVDAFKDKNSCAQATANSSPVPCNSVKCDVRVGS